MFNSLISLSGSGFRLPALQLALPLGISFYTLTAVGYMVDVSRGKYTPEKNFGKLTLFLCFFPQILEGPICRYDQTAAQLAEGHEADYQGMLFGLQRIVWGLFKKWWWRTDCICWSIPSPNPPRSIPELPLCCS